MKTPTSLGWLLLVLLAGRHACLGAEATLDDLVKDSPFLAGPDHAPKENPAGTLEFRGYFAEGRELFFSIYDSAQQRSLWLGSGEADGELIVRGFDAENLILRVETAGRVLALPLLVAKVQTAASDPAGKPATATTSAGFSTDAMSRAQVKQVIAREREAAEARRKAAVEKQRQAYEERRKAAAEGQR